MCIDRMRIQGPRKGQAIGNNTTRPTNRLSDVATMVPAVPHNIAGSTLAAHPRERARATAVAGLPMLALEAMIREPQRAAKAEDDDKVTKVECALKHKEGDGTGA